MNPDDSFNQHLDRAVRHYSSLFTLPSYRRSLAFSWVICQVIGLLHAFSINPVLSGLVHGLVLGFSLFAVTVLINYCLRLCAFRKDPVYDLRRIAALSLFCWIFWLPFILMGSFAAFLFSRVWAVRLCLMGFSTILILRLITLYVTSSSNVKSFLAASIVPPLLCLAPFTLLWLNVANPWRVSLFLPFALAVALFSSFLFIALLNNVGRKVVGFPSLYIFKAFLLNWIANLNEPFEYFLESLGEESEVDVSILRFDREAGSVYVVVPSVHPGPFKNIGSSLLPSMLKDSLEQKLGGVVCVPLGLLGHERDLASQKECQKIIDHVVESVAFIASEDGATPFFKVKNEPATVCCQWLGNVALFTFSLAPHTTEDLPPDLGLYVQNKAEKMGLENCVFVNAHNSIDGVLEPEKALKALEEAALACLDKVSSSEKFPFKVGAAVVKPKEFSLSDGMGSGGITVVVVEVGGAKTAYVVFDGNNMVSGLREKILSALKPLGIHDGEVLTTDTHSVNAVTLTTRGYHPIGEVMNHERIVEYIKEATCAAIANLSQAKVGFRRIKIRKVRVIGREALEKLCVLPDMVVQRAKRVVVPLFAATSLLLMLVLLSV
ncbi:MAG: DUF2070 family protein [Candidatus Bathyarchaeia archaeon]